MNREDVEALTKLVIAIAGGGWALRGIIMALVALLKEWRSRPPGRSGRKGGKR